MTDTSRRLAKSWPYKRQKDYERRLRQSAAAWYAGHGFKVSSKHAYILAELDAWPQNILLPEVVDYIKQTRSDRHAAQSGFPLHKYVHHGLSSQAMLINLVGPLIVRRDFAPLQAAFAQNGIVWPDGEIQADFEVEDRAVFNEDSGQPTSIDLVIRGQPNSPALFIEAKLIERAFGGCSVFAGGDCDGRNPANNFELCYLHHIGRGYWRRLSEFGFLQGALQASPVCLMAMYYQFFREVLFALAKRGSFVLLYDERNPVFDCASAAGRRGLVPFLTEFVPEEHRHFVKSTTIQQVVTAIEELGKHQDWIGQFKQKYGVH